MAKIILISGKAEHGKTALANILKNELIENSSARVALVPFADYLKFICRQYYGWDGVKDSFGRTLLQHVGTDVIRAKTPDFWVDTFINFAKAFYDEFDFILADDARFPNEIRKVRDNFSNVLSLRVIREDFKSRLSVEQQQHPSEIALDDFDDFDLNIFSKEGLLSLAISAFYQLGKLNYNWRE